MARPAIDDRSVLATMAENWVANCCKVSIRKLTNRFQNQFNLSSASKEILNKPSANRTRKERDELKIAVESASKRIQGKFRKLLNTGVALEIGVHLEIRAVKNMVECGSNEYVQAAFCHSVVLVAKKINQSETNVKELYEKGGRKLATLFPNDIRFKSYKS